MILQMFSQSHALNTVKYKAFFKDFNMISSEIDQNKIADYYLNQISLELKNKNLSLEKAFAVKKNLISGEDFLEGLHRLELKDINESHLNLLLESVQSKDSDNICIDFNIFKQKIENLSSSYFNSQSKRSDLVEKYNLEISSDSQPRGNISSMHLSDNSIFTLSP